MQIQRKFFSPQIKQTFDKLMIVNYLYRAFCFVQTSFCFVQTSFFDLNDGKNLDHYLKS